MTCSLQYMPVRVTWPFGLIDRRLLLITATIQIFFSIYINYEYHHAFIRRNIDGSVHKRCCSTE